MKEKTLDLFWLLRELDKKHHAVYAELEPEQQKEVSPYMLLRWLSGITEPEQLVALGTVATSCLYELSAHPMLLVQVLAACTREGPKRYSWINYQAAAKSSLSLELVMKEWRLTASKAKAALALLDSETIRDLGIKHGMQADELKALEKELKSDGR